VSTAGDINGDLIIWGLVPGSHGQDDAGESYVVFGKGEEFDASLNLSVTPTAAMAL